MSVSAEARPAPEPDDPQADSQEHAGPAPEPRARPARPLVVTGGIAACAAAASGLAVLTTLTAIGWVTAPHVGIGSGLGGVLRTAALLWLVAHHVGFTVRGAGRIGMLPLGLVLIPGALLAVAGRWVVHAGGVTRLRHVGYAAVALSLPYTLLAGALAVASSTPQASPSLVQAVIASFLLAVVAGGLGAARGLAPWPRLARLMPVRPRSIVLGMLGSAAILFAAGAVLAGGSLLAHLPTVRAASDALSPGLTGAALLLLAQLAYVPNAIIWAVAYALGPGFSFGTGTVVAPTGSSLGAVPAFPMLAALPSGAHAAGPSWVPVLVLAVPYLAGVFGGVVTIRIAPTPTVEAAPLWGFATGAATGVLAGLAAAFSGGPLGDGRLAAVGPSGWQVGLVAVLEIGVTAALTAGAVNWLILRRATRASRGLRGVAPPGQPSSPGPAVLDETDDAGGHRIYVNPWAAYDTDDQDRLPEGPARKGTRRAGRVLSEPHRPPCRMLISPPTELVNAVWHACWAATVFAPLMQVSYALSCGQNTARASSHNVPSVRPSPPSTIPLTAPRGRAVPPRRALRFAQAPSQIAVTANNTDRTATYTPRCRLPSPRARPSRLSAPSASATRAR